MRKEKVFMLGTFIAICSSMAYGLVITDDFSADHDYKTGIAGTVWDGLLLNGGKTGTSNAVGIKCAAESGVLTMESYGGDWENDQADGYFLYINVDEMRDFIADVYLSDFVWVYYHDVGISARKIDGPAENHVDHRYFPAWGNGNTLRSVADGVTTVLDLGPDDPYLPYFRLVKTGATYTVYNSEDGVTFNVISDIIRTDMDNVDLQVGLYQGTYSSNTGSVSFDDFRLELVPIDIAWGAVPDNNQEDVPTTTDLSWKAPDNYTPVKYDVYIGEDMNLADATVVYGWTSTIINPLSDMGLTLKSNTTYYWRVDSHQANGGGTIVHTGDIWSFTTLPETPIIVKHPESQTVSLGSIVELSITAHNATDYIWCFSADNIVDVSDVEVGSGSAIHVTLDSINKEGWYYCVAVSAYGSDTSNLARVMTKRLVGWWPLDGNLMDEVDTVVTGAPTHDGIADDPNYAPGIPGLGSEQGCEFFGDGEVVTVTDSTDYFNFYPLGVTISCWARWDPMTTANETLISKEINDNGTNLGWFLSRVTSGKSTFTIHPYQSLGGSVLGTGWYMLTGVYDPFADLVYTYQNGILVDVIGTFGASLAASPTPVVFGAGSADGTVWPASAVLDNIKIWNYPLDSRDVAQEYVDVMGGTICVQAPHSDLNGDCLVDLEDLAQLCSEWLESGIVQ